MEQSPVTPLGDDRPNGARMYDYLLGGNFNFAADRTAVDGLLELAPDAIAITQCNRHFLRRAIRYCVAEGVNQFLDLGSGLPTKGNVHQVAHERNPLARVVYVDNDLIATESTRMLVADNDHVDVLHADLSDPESVLDAKPTRQLLDFTRPVALVASASLHNVPDNDELVALIEDYRSALTVGSPFVLSHFTEELSPELTGPVNEYLRGLGLGMTSRSRAEIMTALAGFTLVEPGLVDVEEWRPDGTPTRQAPRNVVTLGCVGLKTA